MCTYLNIVRIPFQEDYPEDEEGAVWLHSKDSSHLDFREGLEN